MLPYPLKRIVFRCAGMVATGIGIISTTAAATELYTGAAFITSRVGSAQLIDSTGATTALGQHDFIEISNSQIITGEDSQVYMVLTNGLAIGVGANSKLKCARYQQAPFKPERESLQFEPSTSVLQLELVEGTVAISCEHLSPLTEMRLQMPTGGVRLHTGTCVMRFSNAGTHITAYKGTLTFYYPSGEEREFIAEPQRVRITPQSATLGRIAEDETDQAIEANLRQLAEATKHARTRVIFKAPDAGEKPQAILVVPSTYYDQPSARPYQLIDD